MQDTDIEKKKTPLHQAALDLSAVCQAVDELDDIPAVLLSIVGELKAELSSSVDRQILFRKMVDSQIDNAKQMKDAWSHRQKVLENVKASHDGYMLSSIVGSTIPFRGQQGEIKAQQNPVSMVLEIKTDRRSIESVTSEDLERLKVPIRYVQENTFLSLNKDAIKKDLQDGVELGWARLVRNKHIRIYI